MSIRRLHTVNNALVLIGWNFPCWKFDLCPNCKKPLHLFHLMSSLLHLVYHKSKQIVIVVFPHLLTFFYALRYYLFWKFFQTDWSSENCLNVSFCGSHSLCVIVKATAPITAFTLQQIYCEAHVGRVELLSTVALSIRISLTQSMIYAGLKTTGSCCDNAVWVTGWLPANSDK